MAGKTSSTKKRDANMHPPRENYRVVKASVNGTTVECELNPRQPGKKATKWEFDCSSEEHADLFALHVPRIHARWKKSSLLYSLRRYAGDGGHQRLIDARVYHDARAKSRAIEAERRRRIRQAQKDNEMMRHSRRG